MNTSDQWLRRIAERADMERDIRQIELAEVTVVPRGWCPPGCPDCAYDPDTEL